MKALPAAVLEGVLDDMPVARLALHDLKDRPEALPIVFARVADALWSPIDGKPKGLGRDLGRIGRLERAPDVMLLFDHYAQDWRDLWWIRLKARAEVLNDKHPDFIAAINALDDKYPQYQFTPMFKDEPTILRFSWFAVGWWASDGLAGIERWLAERPNRTFLSAHP